MPKTNAQRQADYRARIRAQRHKAATTGDGSYLQTITLTIDARAHLWLRRLAHYHGMSQSQIAEALIAQAQEELGKSISADDYGTLCDTINAADQ